MRNPVACASCRTSKRQCIHNNRPPCKRCKDRGDTCVFPPPGTSAMYRQRKSLSVNRVGSDRSDGGQIGRMGEEVSQLLRSPGSSAMVDLSKHSPYEYFTDEVKNSFLRCSYKWCFYHTPSLLRGFRKKTVDDAIMWAILALAIRFSKQAPAPFSTPLEASNAFSAYAKSLVLPFVEEPTLSRIQILLMITGHSWGAGEGHRAWTYLGMAIRMAQYLELFDDDTSAGSDVIASSEVTQEAFKLVEERRRTAWTCFLMDSLLSGGKKRRRALSERDMRIPLPCEATLFHFLEPTRCYKLDQVPKNIILGQETHLDIVGHSMRIAGVWGDVARWACSQDVHGQLPWQDGSEFKRLMSELSQWRYSLPHRLQFSLLSLQAHTAAGQGQAYCYMHAIYFMSLMFLHRSYLSQLEAQNKHDSDSQLDRLWRDWQASSRKELLKVSNQVCQMYGEMADFGGDFLCGLVPWIGFTVYTAVGIMLYYYLFPDSVDDQNVSIRAREHVINGLAFLKTMRGSWPMADTWRETIKRMQIFYTTIKNQGEQSVSLMEKKEMQDAVVDYGALSKNPVVETPATEDHLTVKSSDTGDSPHPYQGSVTPSDTSGQGNETLIQPSDDNAFLFQDIDPDLMLTDLNFDINLPITDDEVVAMLSTSTQNFWGDFPGETEMY
ncbi:hypothetical protein BT63DRAFT_434093 [Microthyrium microscopicum]|uniref:Zn(2)-C6 fungal-type domain-containing protein n=1 Tax=Microthyrium microscopicum TaxID=703497 RepID=A0A6A6U263_9PEZI|nr:hypothetical protein BT63DRAFT_434093 [Microthyrium microscopicum]